MSLEHLASEVTEVMGGGLNPVNITETPHHVFDGDLRLALIVALENELDLIHNFIRPVIASSTPLGVLLGLLLNPCFQIIVGLRRFFGLCHVFF